MPDIWSGVGDAVEAGIGMFIAGVGEGDGEGIGIPGMSICFGVGDAEGFGMVCLC